MLGTSHEANNVLIVRLALQLIRAEREEDLCDSLEFVQCRLMGTIRLTSRFTHN